MSPDSGKRTPDHTTDGAGVAKPATGDSHPPVTNPKPPTEPSLPSSRRILKELLGGSFIVVASGYILAYCAHLGFYGAFGLSPEDVGLSASTALPRLSLAAAVALGVLGIATMLGVGLGALLSRWFAIERGWWWFLGAAGAVLLMAAFVVLGVWTRTPLDESGKYVVTALIGLTTWVIIAVPLRERLAKHVVVPVLITGVLLGAVAFCVNATAYQMGTELRLGERNPGMPLMGITPPLTEVTWIDEKRAPTYLPRDPTDPLGRKESIQLFLLVGANDKKYALYDCRRRRVYVLNQTDVDVATVPFRYHGWKMELLPDRLQCQHPKPSDHDIPN